MEETWAMLKEEEGREPLISLPLCCDGQESRSLEIHTPGVPPVPWRWSNDTLRRVRSVQNVLIFMGHHFICKSFQQSSSWARS